MHPDAAHRSNPQPEPAIIVFVTGCGFSLGSASQIVLHSAISRDDSIDPSGEVEASVTRITIFDLDRTLTKSGTYSPFLLYFARLNAPWRLAFVPAVLACMAGYKLGLMSRKTLKQTMHRLMIGPSISRARIEAFADQFAERQLARNVYPQAAALIEREAAQGRMLIVATAAHSLYAQPIAVKLGIRHVVGTRSTWRDDQLTPFIAGTNCHSGEKLVHLAAYLAEQRIDRRRADLRFYSDDVSDRPIFEYCDERIAMNPSRRLKVLAERKGWQVLDWR